MQREDYIAGRDGVGAQTYLEKAGRDADATGCDNLAKPLNNGQLIAVDSEAALRARDL